MKEFLVIDCIKKYEYVFNSHHQLKKWIRDNFYNMDDFYATHLIYEVENIKKYWDANDIK